VQSPHPLAVPPADIAKNREQWVEQWQQVVLH